MPHVNPDMMSWTLKVKPISWHDVINFESKTQSEKTTNDTPKWSSRIYRCFRKLLSAGNSFFPLVQSVDYTFSVCQCAGFENSPKQCLSWHQKTSNSSKLLATLVLKSNFDVMAWEGGCLANLKPNFHKLLIEHWRWYDRKIIALLLAAMPGSTIKVQSGTP